MTAKAKHLIVGVDDDFRVRESLTSLVESAGYRSAMFASAEDLLFSGDLAGADCVVTDIRMGGMDGIELVQNIRAERPELPVIFISGHLDEAMRGKALETGPLGFLYKPFDAAQLLELIRSALAQSWGELDELSMHRGALPTAQALEKGKMTF